MGRRQLNFDIDNELYKEFSKKCIDIEKKKNEVLIKLIKDFIKKK